MNQDALPTDESFQLPDHPTEQQTIDAVAARSELYTADPDGPAYDPFHDSMGAEADRNEMAHNSSVWPAASDFGNYVPAQHLSHEGTPTVESGAMLLDAVLAAHPDMHVVGQRYCLNKVAGALTWKVGVLEQAAALTIEHYTHLERVPRTHEEIGRDESKRQALRDDEDKAAVDLRFTDGEKEITFQVKANADPDAQGADYCAAVDTDAGTLTLHEG